MSQRRKLILGEKILLLLLLSPCVFNCDLPPVLLAEWLGSFMHYCSNTGPKWIPNESAQKAATPAETQTPKIYLFLFLEWDKSYLRKSTTSVLSLFAATRVAKDTGRTFFDVQSVSATRRICSNCQKREISSTEAPSQTHSLNYSHINKMYICVHIHTKTLETYPTCRLYLDLENGSRLARLVQ